MQCRKPRFDPWVGKVPWRRERLPIPVFLPGEFHGLAAYSLWGTASPLSRAPASLAAPKVPTDGLGFPFLTCHVSPPSQAHSIALYSPESSLVQHLSHPDYISSWFLIILYQPHKSACVARLPGGSGGAC